METQQQQLQSSENLSHTAEEGGGLTNFGRGSGKGVVSGSSHQKEEAVVAVADDFCT